MRDTQAGRSLRLLRERVGFTQEELAAIADTDPGYLRAVEAGEAIAVATYYARITRILAERLRHG